MGNQELSDYLEYGAEHSSSVPLGQESSARSMCLRATIRRRRRRCACPWCRLRRLAGPGCGTSACASLATDWPDPAGNGWRFWCKRGDSVTNQSLRQVSKRFGHVEVIRDLSLEIP